MIFTLSSIKVYSCFDEINTIIIILFIIYCYFNQRWDHPHKTSAFYKEGGGQRLAKIGQDCQQISVKTGDDRGVLVKNCENLPKS